MTTIPRPDRPADALPVRELADTLERRS